MTNEQKLIEAMEEYISVLEKSLRNFTKQAGFKFVFSRQELRLRSKIAELKQSIQPSNAQENAEKEFAMQNCLQDKFDEGYTQCLKDNEAKQSIQPLPTDLEIKTDSLEMYPNEGTSEDKIYFTGLRQAYVAGAKWLRSKLEGKGA